MPIQRRSRLLTPQKAAPPADARRKTAAIETARNRLFAELSELRKRPGNPAKPIETAQVLLTRWWGRANWKSRERLIRTAEWLIRLERNRGMQPIA